MDKKQYVKGQLREHTLKMMGHKHRPIVKEMVGAVLSDPMLEKHLLDHNWLSGSSTEVYPITIGKKDITLQMNESGKRFKEAYYKAIARVCAKYPHLFCHGYVSYDGSCPMSVTFAYTNQVLEEMENGK